MIDRSMGASHTPPSTTSTEVPWWKRAVAYQIYPRSFQDSNGDGIGDLRGVIDRLDYLKWLGVDVIWLSPIYPSPQTDGGYDVSDYRDIDPLFGSLQDFQELLAAIHERGMRLLMDIVVSHTSDEHPWFLDSKSSVDSPRRDWYWWRTSPTEGTPPNNWESRFSGPVWEFDNSSGQYYLHLFATTQPDLNWENPQVREAVYDMMRWWLDLGVDGFRMDVINFISKVPELPDGVPMEGTPYGDGRPYYSNGPRLHEFLQEMHHEVVADRDDVLLIVGETPQNTTESARKMTDPAAHELDMVFQFEHITIDYGQDKWDPQPLRLSRLKRSLGLWQDALADTGWNSLYWENHDQPRIVSRWGDDGAHREVSAKAFGTVLHMHRGTPYVYQGEEIGMTNAELATIEDFTDIQSLNHYTEAVGQLGADPEKTLKSMRLLARDNGRTPMQWSSGTHAGFSGAAPWMAVNANYPRINVDDQRSDRNSVLAHYRELIRLRHSSDLVALGSCRLTHLDHEQLYVIERAYQGEQALTIANLSADPVELPVNLRGPAEPRLVLVLSNYPDSPGSPAKMTTLRPWEALVFMSPHAANRVLAP